MNALTNLALGIDVLAMAFVFGSTAWFFFVQSPVLMKRMGRERFVPLQMRLAVVLFRTLTIALAVMLGATIAHSESMTSAAVITAAVALFGSAMNQYVIVPRALRAGGQSRREIKGRDGDASTASFASEGAGTTTRSWHRAVVLGVLVMFAGVVPHAMMLVG